LILREKKSSRGGGGGGESASFFPDLQSFRVRTSSHTYSKCEKARHESCLPAYLHFTTIVVAISTATAMHTEKNSENIASNPKNNCNLKHGIYYAP
jgi:hypothetical protein